MHALSLFTQSEYGGNAAQPIKYYFSALIQLDLESHKFHALLFFNCTIDDTEDAIAVRMNVHKYIAVAISTFFVYQNFILYKS